jgi:uncharacterized protein YqhQ
MSIKFGRILTIVFLISSVIYSLVSFVAKYEKICIVIAIVCLIFGCFYREVYYLTLKRLEDKKIKNSLIAVTFHNPAD